MYRRPPCAILRGYGAILALYLLMHIPDGVLSTPVWAALDAAAVGVVAFSTRRAERDFGSANHARIPLLGMMGAFVFAAQMINFPLGAGTSGHLVGGALLMVVLGPWAASVVMTAILILQALILQDGGILALGANICNMAMLGVLAAYVPYRVLGRGRTRGPGLFLAGFCSVAVSAAAAMTELSLSHFHFSRSLWITSAILFGITGAIEGAITVAAVSAIERVNPALAPDNASPKPRFAGFVLLGLALVLAIVLAIGVAVASSAPDALQAALAGRMALSPTVSSGEAPIGRRVVAGMGGMLLVFASSVIAGRLWTRRRPV